MNVRIKKKEKEDLDVLFGTSPKRELKLSYSRTSDFDRNGPKCLIKRTFVENDGAKIGSITDDLLYTKLVDKSHFNKLYYKYDSKKPTATLLKLCNLIFEQETELPSKEQIFKIIKKQGFWSGTVDEEKLYQKFDNKQFWDYMKASYESKTKTIVSTEEYNLGDDLVNILLTHENSKSIFDDSYINAYQFPINFEFKEFTFRGILDILRINHKNKTVKMIDLKTGKDNSQFFLSSFLKWRYDLQEAVYTAAFNSICKELGLKGYTLLPFEFLYISRYEKIPLVYEISDKWHKAALNGYTTSRGVKVRGLKELVDEIKWHWDNKVFDTTKLIYEAKGRIVLEDSFIEIN